MILRGYSFLQQPFPEPYVSLSPLSADGSVPGSATTVAPGKRAGVTSLAVLVTTVRNTTVNAAVIANVTARETATETGRGKGSGTRIDTARERERGRCV